MTSTAMVNRRATGQEERVDMKWVGLVGRANNLNTAMYLGAPCFLARAVTCTAIGGQTPHDHADIALGLQAVDGVDLREFGDCV